MYEKKEKNNQFVFVVAVNNEIYLEECIYYINRLNIPEGFSVDVLTIREADSMCAAYNLGMKSSVAKYKIYLHQDVFIQNENFLYDILRIFEENTVVGMIGMIGGNDMPKNGVIYQAWDIGVVDCRDADMAYILCGNPDIHTDTNVEAIDGLLMATQYDIPWREDLFNKFDFYDVSQSFEMRKHGYQIVVPYQEKPWVIHDSSFAKLVNYDDQRKICMREYADYLYADNGFELCYNKEWDTLCRSLIMQVQDMIERGDWKNAVDVIAAYRKGGKKDSTMEMLGLMVDIYESDCKSNGNFYVGCTSYNQMYERYIRIRFLLRRMELGLPEIEYEELKEAITSHHISREVLLLLMLHGTVNKKRVCLRLQQIYEDAAYHVEAEWAHDLYGRLQKYSIPQTFTKKLQNLKNEKKTKEME